MVRRSLLWWIGYLLVSSFLPEGNALRKRVCVIGTGPAGLASVKQLTDRIDEFEPVVFEKSSDAGGLWLYSDNTGVDQFDLPVHSSMYSYANLSEGKELKKRVCVIGAGSAGLASVKQLADRLDDFEPVVFEKNSDVGGLWLYTDNTGVDQFNLSVHSSMYSDLRTNVPTDLMAFPDYKNFTDGDRSCARHEVVLQYLRDFTSDFNLRQYIRFNTLIEKVYPKPCGGRKESRWIVTTQIAETKKRNKEICDAVIVCNGHFFKPNIPNIPGIKSFPGRIFHSHQYRKAEEFRNQTVVILGAGTSGPDIAVEISNYAKTVFLSHRHAKLLGERPSNIIEVAAVIAANGNKLILQDGSKIIADVFIYCTGYLHDYPFLDESSGVHLIDGGRDVGPLYKYVVNVEHNSMGFVGWLPTKILGFPMTYLQAQYYVAVLQGKVKLPSRTEMLENVQYMKSLPGSRYDIEWAYSKEYVKGAHIKPLPNYYETAIKLWLGHLYEKRFDFKDYNLHIANDGHLTIYKPENI